MCDRVRIIILSLLYNFMGIALCTLLLPKWPGFILTAIAFMGILAYGGRAVLTALVFPWFNKEQMPHGTGLHGGCRLVARHHRIFIFGVFFAALRNKDDNYCGSYDRAYSFNNFNVILKVFKTPDCITGADHYIPRLADAKYISNKD